MALKKQTQPVSSALNRAENWNLYKQYKLCAFNEGMVFMPTSAQK